MPLPEPGRYGVVRTGGVVSWLIRRATRSWANHAFIVGDNATVIEAGPHGVRAARLANYAGQQLAFNTVEPMTGRQRAAVVDRAQSMIGDEYAYADLGTLGLASLGFRWRRLFRLIGADKNVVVCSQLVAECGQAAGLDWMCGHDQPDEVTPADLAARPGMQPYTGPLAQAARQPRRIRRL